jgi:hypothetical protein
LRRASADHDRDFPLIPADAGIHADNADISTHFSFGRGGAGEPKIGLRSFAQTTARRARALREKRR